MVRICKTTKSCTTAVCNLYCFSSGENGYDNLVSLAGLTPVCIPEDTQIGLTVHVSRGC